MLAFDIRLPRSPLVWAAFLLAVLLAVTVSFGLRFLVVLTGFWLHDSEGVRAVVLVVAMFFSGMLLPITLFPGWLGDLAAVLPWAALVQIPADVFLERRTGTALAGGLAFQLVWAAALFVAGRAVLALAVR